MYSYSVPERAWCVQAELYWLNYQGREILYRTLEPGGEFHQPTYLSHPWVVRDKETHRRLVRRDTNTAVTLPRTLEFTCHIGPRLPSLKASARLGLEVCVCRMGEPWAGNLSLLTGWKGGRAVVQIGRRCARTRAACPRTTTAAAATSCGRRKTCCWRMASRTRFVARGWLA
jgi:hypothetical protein